MSAVPDTSSNVPKERAERFSKPSAAEGGVHETTNDESDPPFPAVEADSLPRQLQALSVETDPPPTYVEVVDEDDDAASVESPISALPTTSPLTTETSKWRTALEMPSTLQVA